MTRDIEILGGIDGAHSAAVLFPDKREESFGIKPGEVVEAFYDRVRAYAEARGADAIVFGGLE